MKKRRTSRSTDRLMALDHFLKEEGKLEEFEAIAIKEVLAWQIAEAMKAQNLSRKRLAERMKTSRSQQLRLPLVGRADQNRRPLRAVRFLLPLVAKRVGRIPERSLYVPGQQSICGGWTWLPSLYRGTESSFRWWAVTPA
jgi:hypothetical protein